VRARRSPKASRSCADRGDEGATDRVSGVLQDLVVLDLTRFLSGPYCTLLLAGLGAEVIKIDAPGEGDPTAGAPPFVGPEGVGFERRSAADFGIAYLKRARGKQSTTLNLKHPEGRALLLRLAEHADVVVENFRPGVAERLGIGYATLSAVNPRLVYCAITGYGASGPDRELKSYDLMAQAAVGLMSITGEPDGPPMKTAGALSDMIAGSSAALAILGAVHERTRSGLGQAIDVSMVDSLFAMMMDEPLDGYAKLGLAARQGNRIMRFSPFNAYRARDGWVTIGVVTPSDWQALVKAMGREDLAEHPDYRRVSWRLVNNAVVDGLVAQWASEQPVAEIVAQLRDADVPCSPVRSPEEAIAWPHLRARGMVRPLLQPDGAPTDVVAADLPIRYSRSETGHARPAPRPGAHTAEVLTRLLGLSAEEIVALARRGAI
jgi:crotonobetainyl-CoA:carnitine CoA-transferase CaiB-like acyl-CoA transferase